MCKYLNPNAATERLRNEWDKYGRLIIAFDIDSTVLPFHQQEYKEDYEPIRELLRELHKEGCLLIAFTAASEERWENIKKELEVIKVPFNYFNESPKQIPDVCKHGKVYANAYLDDRAGLCEVFNSLSYLLFERRYLKLKNNVAELSSQMAKY